MRIYSVSTGWWEGGKQLSNKLQFFIWWFLYQLAYSRCVYCEPRTMQAESTHSFVYERAHAGNTGARRKWKWRMIRRRRFDSEHHLSGLNPRSRAILDFTVVTANRGLMNEAVWKHCVWKSVLWLQPAAPKADLPSTPHIVKHWGGQQQKKKRKPDVLPAKAAQNELVRCIQTEITDRNNYSA